MDIFGVNMYITTTHVYNNNYWKQAVVWMWAVIRHSLMYMGQLKCIASKLTVRTQTNIYTHFRFTQYRSSIFQIQSSMRHYLRNVSKPVRHRLSFSRTLPNTFRIVNGRYSNICKHISQDQHPSTHKHTQT